MQRKRKNHVPQTSNNEVKMPKSRCSGNKFITIIGRLSEEKKTAIRKLGFGGLLQLSCTELRYELCNWVIANYDVPYHRLQMSTHIVVPITPEDVSLVMGIPCNGVDVIVHNRRSTSNRTYNLKMLEYNLEQLPVSDEFCKTFLIFACATILAPNSKLEGVHDIWDAIWDGDIAVQKNWSKFVLQYLEDGINEFRSKSTTYLRGCILFLQLFYLSYSYIPSVNVELTMPLCAAWTDELVKRRLAAEITSYGAYGHVDVIDRRSTSQQSALARAKSQPSTSSNTLESSTAIQARILATSDQIIALTASLARDVEALRSSYHKGPNDEGDDKPPCDSLQIVPYSDPDHIALTASLARDVEALRSYHKGPNDEGDDRPPLDSLQIIPHSDSDHISSGQASHPA